MSSHSGQKRKSSSSPIGPARAVAARPIIGTKSAASRQCIIRPREADILIHCAKLDVARAQAHIGLCRAQLQLAEADHAVAEAKLASLRSKYPQDEEEEE
jgi:hypothetical protein